MAFGFYKIKKYEYISFDIFDTLIRRNINSPTEIFDIVELVYNRTHTKKIKNFKKDRIESELEARKNKKNFEEEITLDDIYNYMNRKINDNISQELKNIEIETEYKMSNKNNDIINLYNECIKNQKVIITSDMYLPREVIEKMLKKNGFVGYKKLYLSSEIKKTKASGKLFDYIIKDLGVKPNKILHIGDNNKSDFIFPLRKGLHAKLLSKRGKIKYVSTFTDNILNNIIENNQKDDYYYNFGFKNMGPLLVGFSRWLNIEKDKNDICKLYFLSRDGNIMKIAYDILYQGETYYTYASRRSLIVPSLWKANDYEEMLSMMNIPRYIKLVHLLERLGISNEDQRELDKYELELDKEYKYEDLITNSKFETYINKNKSKIILNSKHEYNNLRKYLNNKNFFGQIGIVDIGWFGSMQKALDRILEQNITGFYLGLHTRKKSQTKMMHGFLFENDKNINFDNDEYLFNSILEFIFSAFHGSVKRFTENGEVELYDYEYDFLNEKIYLKSIQEGAIDFVKKVKDMELIGLLDFNEVESSKRIFKTCLYPSYKDSKMLGKISLLDNGISKIGTEKNVIYYIIHPKKFINDFRKSTWKIGFLKKVFILPINYYKIVKKMKEKIGS